MIWPHFEAQTRYFQANFQNQPSLARKIKQFWFFLKYFIGVVLIPKRKDIVTLALLFIEKLHSQREGILNNLFGYPQELYLTWMSMCQDAATSHVVYGYADHYFSRTVKLLTTKIEGFFTNTFQTQVFDALERMSVYDESLLFATQTKLLK